MGSGILPENIVGEHNPLCHSPLPALKLYRSKKKPYLNMIQKRRRFLWAKAHLKWTLAKWKTVLWSDESKFEVLFEKMFSQFKHLICHLCCILNKILKFETSTSLHSVFIHNLYSVPTFLESGL